MAAPVTHHDENDLVLRIKTGVPTSPVDLYIHLFVNNITPDCHVLIGTFVECADPSYLPIQVLPGDWTFADYPGAGGCGRYAQTGTYTFTFTGGGFTVYGLWIYDNGNGLIAWTQRFDAPFLIPSGGGALTVQIQDVQQQCP